MRRSKLTQREKLKRRDFLLTQLAKSQTPRPRRLGFKFSLVTLLLHFFIKHQ